jgi:hypothetical protein
MKMFSQIATQLNSERSSFLDNPKEAGFALNKRGVMQKSLPARILARTKEGIKPLGDGLICYADQDINGQTTAAELVRSGKWESFSVGKLWAFINNTMIDLVMIDPSNKARGGRVLRKGFVTENGEVVIDLE